MNHCEATTGTLGLLNEVKLSYYDFAEEYLKFDGTTGTTLLWKNKVMN